MLTTIMLQYDAVVLTDLNPRDIIYHSGIFSRGKQDSKHDLKMHGLIFHPNDEERTQLEQVTDVRF